MNGSVIIWDIETIPDLQGFAAANYLVGKTDAEIREVMGDKFPKHMYDSIVCIGALIAHREDDKWLVDAIGAPHIGERSEKELVQAFVDKIAELKPQLVTFNGNSFDLPVLRYREMVHGVAAPGLSARPYFNRYTDDAIDLCDVLSSFASQAKATLHYYTEPPPALIAATTASQTMKSLMVTASLLALSAVALAKPAPIERPRLALVNADTDMGPAGAMQENTGSGRTY